MRGLPSNPVLLRSDRPLRRATFSGFTMLEVVLTMLVMGIIAAVTLPRFLNSLDHYRADAAARQLTADLQLAQKNARFTGAAETISFDPVHHRYSFSTLADPYGGSALYTVTLAESPYFCSLDQIIADGGPSVTFDGYGFPDQSVQLVVSSGKGVRLLTLDAVTGRISVTEK